MYDEIYAAWRLEIENSELGSLPIDFYTRIADYLRRVKEENNMQDKKSVRTNLLEHEMANAQRIAKELLLTRYRKLLKMVISGYKVSSESLTEEESKLYSGIFPSAESYEKFVTGVVEGRVLKFDTGVASASIEPPVIHKRLTVRFLKPVPSIIGTDMKSYGPFLVEDVASVPIDNAKVLIKQGLAKAIEVQ